MAKINYEELYEKCKSEKEVLEARLSIVEKKYLNECGDDKKCKEKIKELEEELKKCKKDNQVYLDAIKSVKKPQETEEDVSELKSKIEALIEENEQLKSEIEKLSEENKKHKQTIREYNASFREMKSELFDVSNKANNLNDVVETLINEIQRFIKDKDKDVFFANVIEIMKFWKKST